MRDKNGRFEKGHKTNLGFHHTKEFGKQSSKRQKGIPKPKEQTLKMIASLKGKYVGENNWNWKGGKYISKGYRYVLQNGKYVLEHRLIIEQLIGRSLNHKEIVHHEDGNKTNNIPTNLICFISKRFHNMHHAHKLIPPEHIVFDGRL